MNRGLGVEAIEGLFNRAGKARKESGRQQLSYLDEDRTVTLRRCVACEINSRQVWGEVKVKVIRPEAWVKETLPVTSMGTYAGQAQKGGRAPFQPPLTAPCSLHAFCTAESVMAFGSR